MDQSSCIEIIGLPTSPIKCTPLIRLGHFPIHNSPPLVTAVNQSNLAQIYPSNSLGSILKLTSPLCLNIPRVLFTSMPIEAFSPYNG